MRRLGTLAILLTASSTAAAAEPTQGRADATSAPVEPAPAAADPVSTPAPEEPVPPKEPLEVRVLGNRNDTRTPGSGTVISSQEVTRANAQTAAELLGRVNGVQVHQDYGGGMRLDIGVRGLDPGRSRHVLVLEDGIPVAANPYGEPDLFYLIAVERVRAIEVVKGSGNILFGPRTIGGVINFLTLTPPPTPTAVTEIEGGNGQFIRGMARYGDTVGGARYVVQAVHRHAGGFISEPYASTDVMGKIGFDTSDKGQATFKIGFHDDAATSKDVGLTRDMFAQTPRRPTYAPDDMASMRRYETSVIHEQRFTENTKLRTLLYAYVNTRSWRRQNFDREPVPGVAYDHVVGDISIPKSAIYFRDTNTIQEWLFQVAGVEPRLEHRLTTGPLAHTVDVGSRLMAETANIELKSGDTPSARAGSIVGTETHRGIAVSAYLQDRISIGDFILTPGVRVEHVEFNKLVLRQNSADVSIPGNSDATGFIPGVGAVYGTKDANVFAGVHYGWGPPRIADSFGANGVPRQVSAEESINYELGARAFYNKWARVEVNGFYSDFTNQVVAGNPGSGSTLVDGGATKQIGTESAAVVGIGKVLKLPFIMDVTARYTFSRATFAEGLYDGRLVPYSPLHSFNTNLDMERDLDGGDRVGGQVAYGHVSSQYSDFGSTQAESSTGELGVIPSHNFLNATAHYRNKQTGLTLKVTVKNALDQIYIAARRPQGINIDGFRQIFVALRWDYEKAQPAPAQ